MEIDFKDIWQSAVRMSAYEARSLTDGTGKNRYGEVRLDERDEVFVSEYVGEGVRLLAAALSHVVDYSAFRGGKVVLTFVDEARLRVPEEDAVTAALAVYAVGRWMGDKQPERAKYYTDLFSQEVGAMRGSCNKSRPTIEA